jgi:CheY-like chemotaxis protein
MYANGLQVLHPRFLAFICESMGAFVAGVIAAVDDLFFGAKILETARQLDVSLSLVRSPEELTTRARASRPALVIFDLHAESCRPLETIRLLKADPDLKDLPVLGFFSHVQEDLKTAAAQAGCDQILPRSTFTAQLPDILRAYASPA